ncbi:526_t:CDS:2 [Ambispora leptoticha]|uniref:526_t:CDS:1 n=1 Tax=Ambispora leptoticha TaxID=144679 RepID=A0A9N9BAE7_9GLOM|nr:526_t:CDS:2 [Ambispora leptoticha]
MNATATISGKSSLISSNHENSILENLFGYVGTTFFSMELLPQVYKNWKGKNTKGLSATTFLLWVISSFLFGTYTIGVSLSIPIILQPQVSGLLCLVCLMQCRYYSSNNYYRCGHQKDNEEEINIGEKIVERENNDQFEQNEQKQTSTTTSISDNERRLKSRNLRIKCIVEFSFWIALFTVVQTGGVLWIKRAHEKNISWPEDTLVILSTVLTFIAFLPQFYVIFRDKWLMVFLLFPPLFQGFAIRITKFGLAFAPPPFNVLASVVYIYDFMSQLSIILLYYFFTWWNSRKNKEEQTS